MHKLLSSFAIGIALCCSAAAAQGSNSIQDAELILKVQNPSLYDLYKKYVAYAPAFSRYAIQQGFPKPVERLATIIHEIIHVASAAHQGYYINGIYYEPYLSQENWPSVRNRNIMPLMAPAERGIIHSVYMAATLDNTLANVLDEVNAYSHVAPFVCANEPVSGGKQIRNLTGLLNVVEAYLRVVRTTRPSEYSALLSNRLSAGALATIVQNAWSALSSCGVAPAAVPSAEAQAFLARLR